MNHSGPWSWRASKQGTPVRTDQERAYIERVTKTKQEASRKAARKRRQQAANAIRMRNDEPIY